MTLAAQLIEAINQITGKSKPFWGESRKQYQVERVNRYLKNNLVVGAGQCRIIFGRITLTKNLK